MAARRSVNHGFLTPVIGWGRALVRPHPYILRGGRTGHFHIVCCGKVENEQRRASSLLIFLGRLLHHTDAMSK